MPSERHNLYLEGLKRLEISWENPYVRYDKNITISLGDQVIGTVPHREDLEAGRQFSLPNGSVLSVRLGANGELQLLRDGQTLPVSPDAGRVSAFSLWLSGLYGVYNMVHGLIVLITQSDPLRIMSARSPAGGWQDTAPGVLNWLGAGRLLLGLAFLVGAFFSARRPERVASWGIVLFIVYAAFFVVEEVIVEGSFGLVSLLALLLFFFVVGRVFTRVRNLWLVGEKGEHRP
jgi:hypothetical protein